MSESINLEGMTGKEIINLVRRKTNKRITLSPKSKKSIIKLARELLGGVTETKGAEVKSAKVKAVGSEADNVLHLPDDRILYNSVKKVDIENFLKDFAVKNIISRAITSYLATAFALIEAKGQCVSDVVMNPNDYLKICRYCKDSIIRFSNQLELKNGLVCTMWGSRVWVINDVCGIVCYPEKGVDKKYPGIVKAKKILKIMN